MPSGPKNGPFTDALIPRRRITPGLLEKQKSSGRVARQSFGGLTYSLLPVNAETTHAELVEWLQQDTLYNTWFNKLHHGLGFKTFGLLPLSSGTAKPPQSGFKESQSQVNDFKNSATAIHKAFETYKTVIRKYKILDADFLRTETKRAEVWQHILVDMIARFEDLLQLAAILTGKNHEWLLPDTFLDNVWYAWGWLKVSWREINTCHVFLKRNFLEDDGSFGQLRDLTHQLGDFAGQAPSNDSEDDFLSRNMVSAIASVRRSNTVFSRIKRLGSKMKK